MSCTPFLSVYRVGTSTNLPQRTATGIVTRSGKKLGNEGNNLEDKNNGSTPTGTSTTTPDDLDAARTLTDLSHDNVPRAFSPKPLNTNRRVQKSSKTTNPRQKSRQNNGRGQKAESHGRSKSGTSRRAPPRRDDNDDDTRSVQLIDEVPREPVRTTLKSNTGAKRVAGESGRSKPKKVRRSYLQPDLNLLSSSPPPILQFRLALCVEYEDVDTISTSWVVPTDNMNWHMIENKEKEFFDILKSRNDANLGLISREVVISGNTKTGRTDHSSPIHLDNVLDWREAERVLKFNADEGYSAPQAEVKVLYAGTKNWKRSTASKTGTTAMNTSQEGAEKSKKTPTVSERVAAREGNVLQWAQRIREKYLCNSGLCRNASTYCVPDPVTGTLYALNEHDIGWWARMKLINDDFSIDPPHPDVIAKLKEMAVRAEQAKKKKRRGSGSSSRGIVVNTYVGGSHTLGQAGGATTTTPPAAPAAAAMPSSPPRGIDLSCEEFCEFIGRQLKPAIQTRLIEVGRLLDSKFWAPSHVHRLARLEKDRLRADEIEDGIIERLASRRMYHAFMDSYEASNQS